MAVKKVFVCSECDYQSSKWLGRCPECGAWNSFNEETLAPVNAKKTASVGKTETAVPFSEMEDIECVRYNTGIEEFDRVLGGGLVKGSAVLLAGEPGIGKSTLLMQFCGHVNGKLKVLYVSGEESKSQLKMRASRLGTAADNILVLTETDLDVILSEFERIEPDIMIIDSIQTLSSKESMIS